MTYDNITKIFTANKLSVFLKHVTQLHFPRSLSGSIFAMCNYKGLTFLTKIVMIDEKKSSAETEIDILWKLTEEFADKTPAFIKIYYNYKWQNNKKLIDYPRDEIQYLPGSVKQLIMEIQRRDSLWRRGVVPNSDINVSVIEICHQTLSAFIEGAYLSPVFKQIFETLMFVIIHGFAVVRKKYPKFTHFDLQCDNIMIRYNRDFAYDPANTRYLEFALNGKKWYIPYYGCDPKVIDFGHSVISGSNPAHANKELMFDRIDNDILYFAASLEYLLRTKAIPQENFSGFFDAVDPNNFRSMFDAEIYRRNPRKYRTYEAMLNDKIYEKYTKRPADDLIIHKFDDAI